MGCASSKKSPELRDAEMRIEAGARQYDLMLQILERKYEIAQKQKQQGYAAAEPWVAEPSSVVVSVATDGSRRNTPSHEVPCSATSHAVLHAVKRSSSTSTPSSTDTEDSSDWGESPSTLRASSRRRGSLDPQQPEKRSSITARGSGVTRQRRVSLNK